MNLILTRTEGDKLIIELPDKQSVTVNFIKIRGKKATLEVQYPRNINVFSLELLERMLSKK